MSPTKIIALVIYVILAALAFTQPESALGIWSLRILVLLAVAHLIEVLVFYKVYKEAPGSLLGHAVSVFLFGIVHVNEVKGAQAKGDNA